MQLDERRNVLARHAINLDVKSTSPNPSTRTNSRQSRLVVSDLEMTGLDSKWKKQHPWEQREPRRASEPNVPARVVAFYPSVKRRHTIVKASSIGAHGRVIPKSLGEIPTIPSEKSRRKCCVIQ